MTFHPLPLGVEQVGDAVQRHHGLPGARAALDHQQPRVIEPDDLVLLGLDRRHDVDARVCGTGGADACSPGSRRWRRRTRATPAPANRATPVRSRYPRRKGRSGRCTNVRPKGCPTGRNTARGPPRPAASPLWPARAPRRPVPWVSRRFPATPRCTHPSLARARRRVACRARPRSSARTAIPLRTPVRHRPLIAFEPKFVSAGIPLGPQLRSADGRAEPLRQLAEQILLIFTGPGHVAVWP
jgi:hypothetical protein